MENLYTIAKIQPTETGLMATVNINVDSPVFLGHFPSQPVLPGVTIIDMLKEIIQQYCKKNIRLSKADYVKYLKVLDPERDVKLDFEVNITSESSYLHVLAHTSLADGSVNCKFKGTFIQQL